MAISRKKGLMKASEIYAQWAKDDIEESEWNRKQANIHMCESRRYAKLSEQNKKLSMKCVKEAKRVS